MFNVKAVIQEVEAEKNPESEDSPRANCANRANNEPEISTISTISTPPIPENENIGKIEPLKLVYGLPSNNSDAIDLQTQDESVPFTDHEIAEHKIDQLNLRDDRAFVRQMLLGAYGKDRLTLVDRYFNEWRKGVESEPIEVKKENAGRWLANTWLRGMRGKHK